MFKRVNIILFSSEENDKTVKNADNRSE